MQVDPIKPTLKAPGTKRLKLKYYSLPSSFAFKFNLRRYTKVEAHKTLRDATVGRCTLTPPSLRLVSVL
jgi:hypothetical protein